MSDGRCLLLLALLLLVGCAPPAPPTAPPASRTPAAAATQAATPTASPVATAPAAATSPTPPPPPRPPATPATGGDGTPYAGPFPAGDEARCGRLLPVLPPASTPAVAAPAEPQALATIPEAARPAVVRILEAPGTVSLVAYEIGREAEGIFFNGVRPMPLASVVKLIHLVAYAEAVQQGELDPRQAVPLAELEQYYLANSDLNAHPEAVEALRTEGMVAGDPPAVPLEAVPRMMIEFSSNAATDYLHQLLGQERLEETILALGLDSHTAPCPFLGQFLLMGSGNDIASVEAYVADPARYSRDVWAVTEAYVAGEGDTAGWRGRWRRPSLETQAAFGEMLSTQASAADYGALLAQIAENQLGPWAQNVLIRRYLEWPTFFAVNQESLAWLGYKGGSLPGILTAAYYAQPWNTDRPVVVALFYRDLPLDSYRRWRRTLPNDELARWLLYEREAIPMLREILESGD